MFTGYGKLPSLYLSCNTELQICSLSCCMLALVFLSTQVCIVAVRGYAVLFARREMFICLKFVTP